MNVENNDPFQTVGSNSRRMSRKVEVVGPNRTWQRCRCIPCSNCGVWSWTGPFCLMPKHRPWAKSPIWLLIPWSIAATCPTTRRRKYVRLQLIESFILFFCPPSSLTVSEFFFQRCRFVRLFYVATVICTRKTRRAVPNCQSFARWLISAVIIQLRAVSEPWINSIYVAVSLFQFICFPFDCFCPHHFIFYRNE